MHPYFLDRLANDHWDNLTQLACADAASRRSRSRRSGRRSSRGRNGRLSPWRSRSTTT